MNRWSLTQGAFDLLLAQLDADRNQAGTKYESLRHKLVKFFQWRGCGFPEDLADETLNRVARNLERGEDVRHLAGYCAGIARHVFLESLRALRHEEELQGVAYPSPTGQDEDPRQECLERCLRRVSLENSQLIMEYYRGDEQARIEARRILAARLGIPMNALRIRAHRIRLRLQDCVEECVSRLRVGGNRSDDSSL